MARTVTGTGGLWSANGTWVEGSPPGTADVVTIPKNTSVIVDDTAAVADSIVLSNGTTGADVGGILTCTTSANWKLTLQNGITTGAQTSNPSNTATYTSSVLFDMSASAYTGELVVNAAGNTSSAFGNVSLFGNYVFKGAARKRHSVIESALVAASTTSVFVTDATGWKVGDQLIFATTSAWNATPKTDRVEIDSITFDNAPTNTGRAQITWSESLAYAHASGCPVGNFTSNLIFRPATNNARSTISITSIVNQQSMDCYMDNVAFGARVGGADYGCYSTQSPGGALYFTYINAGPNWSLKHKGFTNNSFYQYRQGGMAGNYMMGPLPRNNNIFFSTHGSGSAAVMWSNQNGKYYCDSDEDYVIFASTSGIQNTTSLGAPISYPGCIQRRHKISGITDSGNNGVGICTSMDVEDCDLWSNAYAVSVHYGAKVKRCRFDEAVFAGATSLGSPAGSFMLAPTSDAEAIDCEFGAGVLPKAYDISLYDNRKLTVVNRNPAVNGAAIQEIFQYQSQTVPAIQRNTATVSRSTSSMEFTLNSATAQGYAFEVLAKAGETIKMLVLVRKSSSPAYGASTLPKVTVSGLGITPVVATMAGGTAADAWETLTVEATNTGSADGNFTVTFTAQSATAGAKAFFAGIPAAPFITRCRHYGYLFNETSPTRTADPLTSANFATADAYTGMAITWGASSSTAITTSNTFQKLFDYHQAKAVQNVGSAVALTGAGAAGSPALFAAGNVTISDGAVLNGSGSISIGAYTLATEFASGVNYTYTGGAWSQQTTIPTFAGGTLTLGALVSTSPGFTMATGAIVFNATSALWDLSTCTIGSGVTLSNTSGAGITVAMPAGYPTTTIGSGATEIIVTAPAVERGLEFTLSPTGCQVKVFATGTDTELFSDNAASGTETWDDATSGSITVDYVVQKAGYLPVRVTGVVVTGAVGTGIQAVAVTLSAARWYQASSGLTINTNAFANAGIKLFGLTATSTLQNFASYMLEQWIALGDSGEAFANKEFPIEANGPNSFTFRLGWEWDLTTYANSISNLSRDGQRYMSAAGAVTASWAAILTSGALAGSQVRYQQSDAGTTVDAENTGEMDQLVQIYGDATHGNFDKTGYLVLKVQREGYDQAEANVVTLYGTLEDQLYVVGLTPTANSIATGDPALTITISQGTYTEDGKTFSVKIVDNATPSSGADILRELRYNFAAGGAYQGEDAFNWHDLVQKNGDNFKTVNGTVYGTAATKGVLVYKNDGTTLHPDFNLFTADNGTTYAPPVAAPITWAGALNATTCLLYNDRAAGALIDTQTVSGAGGYVWSITLPHASVAIGDSLRLRYGHKEYYADELQGTMTATGISFVGSMTLHPVYAGWALNGATYDQANGGSFTMDGTNLQIDIDNSVTTGLKTQLGAWTQYLMTLPAGLDAFYGAWDLLELNQIRQNVAIIDVLLDLPVSGAQFAFTDNEVNYYRSDFTLPYNIEAGHGNIFLTYNAKPFVALVSVGGSPMTTDDRDAILAAIPSAGTNATATRSELATELARLDAAVSSRASGAAVAALPTDAQNAAATRSELAVELADVVRARKLLNNKRVVDPDTGLLTVYDDDGTTVLGSGLAYLDAAGTQPYDGTAPVHRTEAVE